MGGRSSASASVSTVSSRDAMRAMMSPLAASTALATAWSRLIDCPSTADSIARTRSY
jgi:hypothetical protein